MKQPGGTPEDVFDTAVRGTDFTTTWAVSRERADNLATACFLPAVARNVLHIDGYRQFSKLRPEIQLRLTRLDAG